MEEIAIANAAIALIEALAPKIQAAVKSGQVTPTEQQTLLDKYNSLKTNLDAAFSGPEWTIQ
jgi:hypothetical protein